MSFLEDITLVIVNYNSRNVILNSLAPLKTLKNIIVGHGTLISNYVGHWECIMFGFGPLILDRRHIFDLGGG